MSRARHRASGGKVSKYNAQDSNVMKEAEEKKKGGRVHGEGSSSKPRSDRPGRKRGGRIGANLMPLSTAAKVTHVTKGEGPETGEPSD
jgi:hypothetical protein